MIWRSSFALEKLLCAATRCEKSSHPAHQSWNFVTLLRRGLFREFLTGRRDSPGACSGRDGTHFPDRWFRMVSRNLLSLLLFVANLPSLSSLRSRAPRRHPRSPLRNANREGHDARAASPPRSTEIATDVVVKF